MRLKKAILIGVPSAAALVVGFLVLTHPPASAVPTTAVSNTAFPNPEPVTIQGYAGSAEVPFLTPDGNYLVFDSRTDPGNPADVKIYYAKKINATNFQFMGEVVNANAPGTFNFEMTIDDHNNFFFTRIDLPPQPNGKPTLYRGVWTNGTLTDVGPVPGITQASGTLHQDPSISHDGQVLIFNVWDYVHKCLNYRVAHKNPDSSFTVLDSTDPRLSRHMATFKDAYVGDYLYRCTNFPHPGMTHAMLMGPVFHSHSGLKVAFTMIQPGPPGPVEKYYLATRRSLSEPFGKPQLVIDNGRVVEGGSFSPDDSLLYFHLSKGDGGFWPYVIPIEANTSRR